MTHKTLSEQHAANQNDDRIGLLVVGMYRSETSAITKTINLLGAGLVGYLMPAHTEFNAIGHFGNIRIVSIPH